MSYPNPPPPPHQFVSPPFSNGGDGAGCVPPEYMIDNQTEIQHADLAAEFDHSQFKRPKLSENPQRFVPYQQMNLRPNNNPQVNVNKGTSHIFFKTRICAKFLEGTCNNGDGCSFAHGHQDLREPPPNWQDLIREKAAGAVSIGVTVDEGASSADFDQSFFRKTKICSKWEMGQCPFGERCHFAHGQSDLRMSGAVDEADVVINTGPIPRKSVSVSAFDTTANLVVGAPPPLSAAVEEQRKADRWKLNKKVNRIYGDWLDDDEEM